MTNAELEQRRRQLRQKTETIAGLSPMLAAAQFKAAALLAAEITDELARRELARGGGDHE